MRYTHPVDRAVYALRGVILAACYLCGPIMLISYGWMARELITTAPVWVSVIVLIAHVVGWLGIASLIDMRRERLTPPEPDQFARPPQS